MAPKYARDSGPGPLIRSCSIWETNVTDSTEIAVFWLTLLLESVILYLRLYTTTHGWRSVPSFSDVCLVAALVFNAINAGTGTWCVLNGDILAGPCDPEKLKVFTLFSYTTLYTYFLALCSIRVSFLALYYPMFVLLSTVARYCVWLVCVVTGAGCLATILMQTFICWPIQRNWEGGSQNCSPMNSETYALTSTVLTVATDLAIMFLALFLLKQLSRWQRLAAAFVIFIGFLSISSSLVRYRLFCTEETSRGTQVIQLNGILVYIETFCAFLAACLPAFRVAIKRSFWKRSSPWSRNPAPE